MAFPCTHLNPASMISHLLESIIIGTREISGSEAIKFKKVRIASTPSSMPSSILTSITCAPFSTCCRATDNASSNLFSLTSRANLAEPVTFVRSPTLMKSPPSCRLKGSRPDNFKFPGADTISTSRGFKFSIASAIAAICFGVVPQQPPMTFNQPFLA